MSADLTNPVFTDEAKAREWLEAKRWPNGPVCSHCGATAERVTRLEGKASRPGLWQCNECHGQFSVTIGTLYERSHIPLHKWLLATHLLTASKKGISSHQLHRMLGVTYKTAWFMSHRIREGMKEINPGKMGGGGKVVEADETFLANSPKTKKRPGYQHKVAVLSLVERGGNIRSVQLDRAPNKDVVDTAISANVHPETTLHTDGAQYYKGLLSVAAHQSVDHAKGEYVRDGVHTNTLEGYFSVLKRGLVGTYQHVSEQHLHRYLVEFDFRYSNRAALGMTDAMRAERAVKGIEGKRLTYRPTH